jgi:hypothetical protein
MIRRKKTQPEPAAEAANPETAVAVADVTAPADADKPAKDARFRAWVTDSKNGYLRLTDEQAGQIVLKFKDKPAPELVDQLKDAGFRYQQEYFGQRKVWTRRNDFEGRLQVEQLETIIRPGQQAIPTERK